MRELHDMIDVLIDKYKDNDYIFNRLKNTILTQLPNALTNAEILYEQRNDRKAMLISNGDKFIEDFLNEIVTIIVHVWNYLYTMTDIIINRYVKIIYFTIY